MKQIRVAFCSLTVAFALILTTPAASAATFGPPPKAPTVTCTTITTDPPNIAHMTVTAVGTVNGKPFSRSVSIPLTGWVEHLAIVNIADLTAGVGPQHVIVYATWTLGPGHSKTADVTLVCHSAPPKPTTTTTTTSTTTSTTVAPPITAVLLPPTPPQLPRTGGSTLPEILLGGALLAGGALALAGSRKERA